MATLNDYFIDSVENSWLEIDSKDNAQATATRAAAAKRHQVVLKCDASYSSSTTSGLLQIKFGTTVVAHKVIHGAGALDFGVLGFENPDANEAVSAVLAASGAGGVIGYITFTGYSTGPRGGEAL